MDKHYKIKEINDIWNDKTKYNNWLKIELAILEYYKSVNKLSSKDFNCLKRIFKCYPIKTKSKDKNPRRDLSLFIEKIKQHTNNKAKKWIHYGVTLCDVVNCAFPISFKQTNDIIYKDLIKFIELLEKFALKYKDAPYIEQSLCTQSQNVSFGLKLALYYKEICRHLDRFNMARFQIEAVKIACDDASCLKTDLDLQNFICNKFDLFGNSAPNDIIQKDTYSFYVNVIVAIIKTIDCINQELEINNSDVACSANASETKDKKCSCTICTCQDCKCEAKVGLIDSISIMLSKLRTLQKTLPNLVKNKINKIKNIKADNKLSFVDEPLKRIFNLSAKEDVAKILMYRWEIEYYVEKIADKLNAKFWNTESDVYLYMLLTGSITFAGKLLTKLNFPCQLKTVQLSFYGKDTKASDKKYDLNSIVHGSKKLKDKHVIILDDLVEDGITINVLKNYLNTFKPKDITTCVLTLKDKKKQKLQPDIYGRKLYDVWLAGYGLDFKGKHRNDDFIWEIRKDKIN